MTVSSQYEKESYRGDGNARAFPFGFQTYPAIYPDRHLHVEIIDSGGSLKYLLSPDMYHVVFNENMIGGRIIYPVNSWEAPLPAGSEIIIYRATPITQEEDFENQGRFFPRMIEFALDKLTFILQEIWHILEEILQRLDELEDRVDELEKRVDSLERRMDEIERRVDELERRIDELEIIVDEIIKRVEELEGRVGSLEEDVGSLQNGFDDLRQRVENIEAFLEPCRNGNCCPCHGGECGSGGTDVIIAGSVISANWTAGSGCFIQRVYIPEVTSGSAVWVQLTYDATKADIDAFNALDAYDSGQGDGWIELRAYGKPNTWDIPVTLVILDGNSRGGRIPVTGVKISPKTLPLDYVPVAGVTVSPETLLLDSQSSNVPVTGVTVSPKQLLIE